MEGRIGVGKAVGKFIIMGEHAVVYGQPALAMPFPAVRVETVVSRSTGAVTLDCEFFVGALADAPEKVWGTSTMVNGIMESFGEKLGNFHIEIKSTIPPGRGLGSSAAVAVSVVRALYRYYGRTLEQEELLKWAEVSEKVVHGNPSGIDAAVTADQIPMYFIKGRPFVQFAFSMDAHMVVADTGQQGQTRIAVEGVKSFIDLNPDKGPSMIAELGGFTEDAKSAIMKNDAERLGKIMNKAHSILKELGVSNDALDHLASTALCKGALGAKLTGGGKGGCIIALASTRNKAEGICDGLISGGAKNAWICPLEAGL